MVGKPVAQSGDKVGGRYFALVTAEPEPEAQLAQSLKEAERRYLSMQVVFIVSSLMYNISVAWAN